MTRYVRVSFHLLHIPDVGPPVPVEISVGVEAVAGMGVAALYREVRTAFALDADFREGALDDAMLAEEAERVIKKHWPERRYFVEAARGTGDHTFVITTNKEL